MAVAAVNNPAESRQASSAVTRNPAPRLQQRSALATLQSLVGPHSSLSQLLSLEAEDSTSPLSRSATTQNSRKRPSNTKQKPQPALRRAQSELGQTSYSVSPDSSPREKQASCSVLSSPSSNALRSPTARRPPASRSANGVATTTGPPPAISTQRAFSFELPNSLAEEDSSPTTSAHPKLTTDTLEELNALNRLAQETKRKTSYTSRSTLSSGRTLQQRSSNSRRDTALAEDLAISETSEDMDQRNRGYSVEGSRFMANRRSAQFQNLGMPMQQDAAFNGSSHDDLFLDMAQTVGTDDLAEAERQPGRALPPHRLSLSEAQPIDRFTRGLDGNSTPRRTDTRMALQTPLADRASLRDRIRPATAHPLEGRLSRFSQASPAIDAPNTPLDSPGLRRAAGPTSYHSRFRSTHIPTTTFASSPVTARHQSSDQDLASSPPGNASAKHIPAGTASTVSTTAPSTVWDELDDLKSRIRKLEVTGKLPPSSNGSIDRPRTAATSATTMSSSSKQNGVKEDSPILNSFEDVSPHPLLNSALDKVRETLNPDSYQALEAAAADALNIVKMSTSGITPTAFERQLKRKADNMCRNLTELCIALSAFNALHQDRVSNRARSSSRGPSALQTLPAQTQPTIPVEENGRRYERASSLGPEATAGQRALSRLEARRSSMKMDNVKAGGYLTLNQTPETNTPTQSTISRTTTAIQRTRQPGEGVYPEDVAFSIRPLSRAVTELNRANTTGGLDRDQRRTSRDYTSTHPLPGPHTRPFLPSSTTLPARRTYLTSTTQLTTPTTQTQTQPFATASMQDEESPAPTTPGFTSRRLLRPAPNTLSNGSPANATNTANTATATNNGEDPTLRAPAESQHRFAPSGLYSTARSLLGRRAGDRRSFAAGGDTMLSANQY